MTMNEQTKNMLKNIIGPYAALVALLAVCLISSPYFRSVDNLVNIARQCAPVGIIALGMTLVIAAGGIDLAVGSLLALCGVGSIMGMNAFPDSPALGFAAAVAIALAGGCAGGAVNGALVSLGKIPPFIATLGTMTIYRSLSLYLAHAGLVTSSNGIYSSLGRASFAGLPLPVWCLLGFTAVFAVILGSTRFGRHVCAAGSNERVAMYSSIRTGMVKFMTYLIIGGTAGASALILGSRLNSISSTGAGTAFELDAIAAVIIGGTPMTGGRASAAGTLAGVLILGIVSNILTMWGVSPNLEGLVKGLVIIAAVLIQRKK